MLTLLLLPLPLLPLPAPLLLPLPPSLCCRCCCHCCCHPCRRHHRRCCCCHHVAATANAVTASNSATTTTTVFLAIAAATKVLPQMSQFPRRCRHHFHRCCRRHCLCFRCYAVIVSIKAAISVATAAFCHCHLRERRTVAVDAMVTSVVASGACSLERSSSKVGYYYFR